MATTDEVQAQVEHLDAEFDKLLIQFERSEGCPDSPEGLRLATVQAKRVQRESRALVRLLAQLRDEAD